MAPRKRNREEMEADDGPKEPSLQDKIRNMWEFASLMQYIHFFGESVKIDGDLDIDELETECLKPTHSEKLSEIGLALLKYVSSHKGLTPEIFDEYTRRQYVAKAPRRNPFGTEEEPNKFAEFDVFTKLRVLHQLSVWTLGNADRIREKTAVPENKQTEWRIEPFGWDAQDRTYFVLDDNRLYRRTDPPIPDSPKIKPKKKPATRSARGSRASKRRRVIEDTPEEEDEEPVPTAPTEPEDTFGGMTWECIAVTLEDYNAFVATIHRSKDPNEKILRSRIQEHILPELEKVAEQRRQKELKRIKELEVLQRLASAKRSSRLADKQEKKKELEIAEEADRKRQADLVMARKEQEKQRKMEEARESRMMTREQRLKDREVKRILQEEELAKLEENRKKADSNEARLSERHLKAEMERRKIELERLNQEDDWFFDCEVCGMHGENIDDGSHSIACEKCNVWQHSACHGFKQEEAEKPDFHFVCRPCRRKSEEAKRPKIPPIKLRVTNSPKVEAKSSSPAVQPLPMPKPHIIQHQAPRPVVGSLPTNGVFSASPQPFQSVYLPAPSSSANTPAPLPRPIDILNGPSLPPFGRVPAVTTSPAPSNGTYHPASSSPIAPIALPPIRAPVSSHAQNHFPYANGGPSSSPPPPVHQYINGLPHQSRPFGSPNAPPVNLPRPTLPPPSFGGYPNTYSAPQHGSPPLPRPVVSPVKLASSPAPHHNGYGNIPSANGPLASSPSASFPPPGAHQVSQSPLKASSPPQPYHPSPYSNAFSGATPGYSPVKTSPRPEPSHSVTSTPLRAPVSFTPNEAALRTSPPTKKLAEPMQESTS